MLAHFLIGQDFCHIRRGKQLFYYYYYYYYVLGAVCFFVQTIFLKSVFFQMLALSNAFQGDSRQYDNCNLILWLCAACWSLIAVCSVVSEHLLIDNCSLSLPARRPCEVLL